MNKDINFQNIFSGIKKEFEKVIHETNEEVKMKQNEFKLLYNHFNYDFNPFFKLKRPEKKDIITIKYEKQSKFCSRKFNRKQERK